MNTESTPKPPPPPTQTAVKFEHTGNFVSLLQRAEVSLLVSTYQAGKLVTVGTYAGAIDIAFHSFEQAMGVAVRPDRLAVGTRRQIWFLQAAPELARRIEPAGKYDTCFLTRSAHFTGLIQGHEMGWSGDDLWLCNTGFSCLCVLDPKFSFVPKWQPKFVSQYAAEDRCHLNGLAMDGGKPRYVTCLGETDKAGGWRDNKASGGLVIDVASGAVIARGLCMPHSPRVAGGVVWVLNSGAGQIGTVDVETSRFVPVASLPGYTRGLAIHKGLGFVGMSKIRETSVFGGIPIAEDRSKLRCGVAVVEMTSGQVIGMLLFHSGVDEVFDVQVLPGVRCPIISGPLPDRDGAQPIWYAPAPAKG